MKRSTCCFFQQLSGPPVQEEEEEEEGNLLTQALEFKLPEAVGRFQLLASPCRGSTEVTGVATKHVTSLCWKGMYSLE